MADDAVEHEADLALVREVVAGDRAALARVDAMLVAEARPKLGALGVSASDIDDALQATREHLFIDGALVRYSGRGRLGAFLAVAAANFAFRRKKPVVADADDAEAPAALFSAEVSLVRQESRALVGQAMREAIAGLTPRERAVLRFAFYDGRTHAEIGAIYGAHRSTVAGWIDTATAKLRSLAQQWLGSRLGAEPSGKLADLLHSTIDLQLSKLLE